MKLREIQEKDNKQVEHVIRTCLLEFGGNREGLAWCDPYLGRFSEVYSTDNSKYFVVEDNGRILGGCGIGPVERLNDTCELQKMYCLKELRGTHFTHDLLDASLEFAKQHYKKCYLETLSNMVAANKFYKKYGFTKLDKPIGNTGHYACDAWYIKNL